MLAIKPGAMATFVTSAPQLDSVIREMLALLSTQSEDQNGGTLSVLYVEESVRNAKLIPLLEAQGVEIIWEQQMNDVIFSLQS